MCESQQTVENSETDWTTRPTYLPPEKKNNMYAGQEAAELDMEQRAGSKLGKEYVKAVYCHSVCLTSL